MDVGEFIVPIPHVKQVKLSTAGGRLIISSDGVWDALSFESVLQCCRGLPPESAANQIVKDAVHLKGLRDDTTCIVVDILPPERTSPPVAPPKKQGMGVFKNMFRKKPSESSSHHSDGEYAELDIVEEFFEDGSAVLAQRLDIDYFPACTIIKLSLCAVCQVDLQPGEGISIHAGSLKSEKNHSWDGPYLCTTCQAKKEAMEGKRPSRESSKKER